MSLVLIIDYLIISIIASMAINSVLRNLAKKNSIFLDIPDDGRHLHKRATPVTGGIGIVIATLISAKLFIDLNSLNGYVPNFTYQLAVCSIALVCFFIIDDLKGLKASKRLCGQALLSAYMVYETGITLETLGNLFGTGSIELGIFSIPITIFSVVGIMNAFNMIDGINGLCSGSAMLSLLLVGFCSGIVYDSFLVLMVGSIIGFLIFNLTILGEKRGVFLGDHGSNLIGFWVAWTCIYATQNKAYDLEAMTAIWFVAIPLLDCIGLLFSRVLRGESWATPGRDHIHHKLMNRFSSEVSLVIILFVSLVLGIFGYLLGIYYPIWMSTLLFIVFSVLYYSYAYYSELKSSLIKRNV